MYLNKRKSKSVKNWKMNFNRKFKNLLEKKIILIIIIFFILCKIKKIKLLFKNLKIRLQLHLKKVKFLSQKINLRDSY